MRFKLHQEHGALNSPPIFAAFAQGLKNTGHTVVNSDQDIDVIWSVLWYGRMRSNQAVYQQAKNQGRPVVIIEVGNIFRNVTWRISVDNINGHGKFANTKNLDLDRPKKLGINLRPEIKNRRREILLACQHEHSLQWQGQPKMAKWAELKIQEIRKFTDIPVVVRPHPRSPFVLNFPGVKLDTPRAVPNTYDDFNFDYNFHCIVNHNSGPGVRAAINGVPVVTDVSSLAYPVSDSIENINDPKLKDREEWLVQLSHTEWTVPEIMQGTPIQRIVEELKINS